VFNYLNKDVMIKEKMMMYVTPILNLRWLLTFHNAFWMGSLRIYKLRQIKKEIHYIL